MEKELKDFMAKKTSPDIEWHITEDNGKTIVLEAIDDENLDFENGKLRAIVNRRNGSNGNYRMVSTNF
jgi:hypothetical protein